MRTRAAPSPVARASITSAHESRLDSARLRGVPSRGQGATASAFPSRRTNVTFWSSAASRFDSRRRAFMTRLGMPTGNACVASIELCASVASNETRWSSKVGRSSASASDEDEDDAPPPSSSFSVSRRSTAISGSVGRSGAASSSPGCGSAHSRGSTRRPHAASVTAGPEARSRSADGAEGSVRGLRVAGIWAWAFGPRGQTMPPDPPKDTGGSACSRMVARAFEAVTAIPVAGQASSRRRAIQAGDACGAPPLLCRRMLKKHAFR